MRRFACLLSAFFVLSGTGTAFAQDDFDSEFEDPAPAPTPAPAPRSAPANDFDSDFDDEPIDVIENQDEVEAQSAEATLEDDLAEANESEDSNDDAREVRDPNRPYDPWDRGELDARRFRMWNGWIGSTGGFHVRDGFTGPAGTFRLQLGFEAFAKDGFLQVGDAHSRVGGTLNLTWSVHDLVEVYLGLASYANRNRSEFPNLLLVLGDLVGGVKVGGFVNEWLAVAGDVGLVMPTSSDLGVGFDGMGISLNVAATADLRGLENPVPFLVRANLGYTFDRSARLIDDIEDFRYGLLPDPAPRGDETRQFLSRAERYALNIRRTDLLNIGIGLEAPIEISDDVHLSPLLEWTMGIPVNRQGFDCPFVADEPGGTRPAPGDDDCLSRVGAGSWPIDLTLGVRVLPPVKGLGAFLAIDIGLAGTKKSNAVRELPMNEPWRLMFGLSYAHDTRDPVPPPDVEEEREVRVEVPAPPAIAGRIRGRVVMRADNRDTPLPGAFVRYEGRDLTTQITGDEGQFVSYAFEPGTVRMELRAEGASPGLCEATIDEEGHDVEVLCVLERNLVQVEDEQVVILEQIQFAFDSDEILEESFGLMQQISNALRDNPQIRRVEIQGHTDDQGNYDYNAQLSQRRAESVQRWLVEHGIDAERLRARGYGESQPLVRDTTEEARARNRRVEFRIQERSE
ncbi:MAG: OmpA family protein [Sandaracinus sp.]|nr:OmpA family protein [Sandaracinus sp.]MCB9633134.1 OmpA family protein [Sandaracinus sp.]